MRALARLRASGVFEPGFGRNAAWYTTMSIADRLIALVQTVIVARSLGIADYGVYGLLFGTIGFVASVAGLQLGLTATVYLARYRVTEKERAAAVILIAGRYGWLMAALAALAAPVCGEPISVLLFGTPAYKDVVVLGMLVVGASVAGGVQDGVAQGFEAFGALAKTRIAASLLALALVYPAAVHFGLAGVVATTLVGLGAKVLLLNRAIVRSAVASELPRRGAGVSFRSLVSSFSLPSMAISLGAGFLGWIGMLVLSRQHSGFESVAVVNVGLQWRAPLLLVASSVCAVSVPVFGRLGALQNCAGVNALRTKLVVLSLVASVAATVLVVALSPLLLQLYGAAFVEGRLAFCLLVASCIPAAVSQVGMQHLIGSAQMWRVFWLHVPHFVSWLVGLVVLVPILASTGYALATLIAAAVLAMTVLLSERRAPADASAFGRADV